MMRAKLTFDCARLAVFTCAFLVSSGAFASPELARARNCVACHHPERKMIGPSYKSIAEKYAGDQTATINLSEKVRKGGGGVWGQLPMPPQAHVSPEDAEALVRWILARE